MRQKQISANKRLPRVGMRIGLLVLFLLGSFMNSARQLTGEKSLAHGLRRANDPPLTGLAKKACRTRKTFLSELLTQDTKFQGQTPASWSAIFHA